MRAANHVPVTGSGGLRDLEAAVDLAGLGPVAGVDEVGRGACAGPLAAGACILPSRELPELQELTDSKQLTAAKRRRLVPVIESVAVATAVVFIEPADIDTYGLQWANFAAMRWAVTSLQVQPGYVLTDAVQLAGLPMPHIPIVKGDATALCIAAASVLAKVARDSLMADYDEIYPGYGFAGHKGYGTAKHMESVRRHGASPIHRYTYANVAQAHSQWLTTHTADTTANQPTTL
ncbi:ribonuclease HII [Corynebacterium choanae]|nr:ribonuclease HII [Corynebacterium choanae]